MTDNTVTVNEAETKLDQENYSNIESTRQEELEPQKPVLTYLLTSNPPIIVTVCSALQHAMMTIPGCLFFSAAVADVACVPYDHNIRSKLFCASLFISGTCTFLQVFFGVRLPILQGPSGAFLVPLLALKTNQEWSCPSEIHTNDSENVTSSAHLSSDQEDNMYLKLQQISGALMLSSVLEISIGSLGLLGLLIQFVGPITIAVTITLIGTSMLDLTITFGRPCFPITITCAFLMVIFCLYCQKVKIPLARCRPKIQVMEQTKRSTFPLFEVLPILIGMAVMWLVSLLLTISGVFTDDKSSIAYLARTDARSEVIHRSPWINISYPFMFGLPRMDLSLALAFVISSVASMFESVGDYYAAQKACQTDRVPKHAMSRGILAEGIGVLISGAVGVGNATTSLSQDIGLVALTKNASRISMLVASLILVAISLFGKVGAVLTTIPNPILGGLSIIVNATVISVGLSNLQTVDMGLTRNMLVVGIPVVLGMVVPNAIQLYPDIFDTGTNDVNRILKVVIGSPMFLGGVSALILDNTVQGSRFSRGFRDFDEPTSNDGDSDQYSWTFYPRMVEAVPCLSLLPFMPSSGTSTSNLNDTYDKHPNVSEMEELA